MNIGGSKGVLGKGPALSVQFSTLWEILDPPLIKE